MAIVGRAYMPEKIVIPTSLGLTLILHFAFRLAFRKKIIRLPRLPLFSLAHRKSNEIINAQHDFIFLFYIYQQAKILQKKDFTHPKTKFLAQWRAKTRAG
jgi:hypothetical protein